MFSAIMAFLITHIVIILQLKICKYLMYKTGKALKDFTKAVLLPLKRRDIIGPATYRRITRSQFTECAASNVVFEKQIAELAGNHERLKEFKKRDWPQQDGVDASAATVATSHPLRPPGILLAYNYQ